MIVIILLIQGLFQERKEKSTLGLLLKQIEQTSLRI